MPIDKLDPEVWKLVGRLEGLWAQEGGDDFGWGSVPTKTQGLTAAANMGVYKLMQRDQSLVKDYYLVTGDVYHGIQNSPNDPESNWVSVGFYANYMNLKIWSTSIGGRVYSFGPNSTVNTSNIGFSVGGNLSANFSEKNGGSGGGQLNAAVNISFTASEVSFRASPSRSSVEWRVALPRVGWLGPAVPANPGRASYGGYVCTPAIIFEVDQGAFMMLSGQLEVDFEYNWTRGIRKRALTPNVTLQYTRDGKPLQDAGAGTRLPTILEKLQEFAASEGRDGETDSFLSVLGRLGLTTSFGDSTLQQLVVAPTNKAIERHFDAHPTLALKWSGVQANRWWEDWIDMRIHNMHPKSAVNPAVIAVLRNALSGSDRLFECADGILVITEDYGRSESFESVLAQALPA
jgi:hypothetical protein